MVRLLLYLTLPLFILDFITKEAVVRHFDDPQEFYHDAHTVVPGFFNLVRVHNTGVAFGMGNQGGYSNLIFGGVAVAALVFIGIMYRTNGFPTRLSRVAAALLISGILGNLFDRIIRGYVVDFLDFYTSIGGVEKHFAAFNVADACICMAAGILFITAFQKVPENLPEERS